MGQAIRVKLATIELKATGEEYSSGKGDGEDASYVPNHGGAVRATLLATPGGDLPREFAIVIESGENLARVDVYESDTPQGLLAEAFDFFADGTRDVPDEGAHFVLAIFAAAGVFFEPAAVEAARKTVTKRHSVGMWIRGEPKRLGVLAGSR